MRAWTITLGYTPRFWEKPCIKRGTGYVTLYAARLWIEATWDSREDPVVANG